MARYLVGIFANLGPTWPSSSLYVNLHQWEDPRSFHQTPRLLTFLHFDGPSDSTISNCIEGMLRNYAMVASKPFSRLRARGKSPVGLDHFIQRQRALALWRDIIRSTANIPDMAARKDMRQFARSEFEQHRQVTDLGHIRYLISYGKTQFQTMKGTLINSGVLTE